MDHHKKESKRTTMTSRNREINTRSGALKRKRRSSDECSNIENEPLREEKRLKEERLFPQEEEGESTAADGRLPLSELSVLRLSGVDLNDREDLSGSEDPHESVASSPFSEDNKEENVLGGEESSPLQCDNLVSRDSPESICNSNVPSPCYDVEDIRKLLAKNETSNKTDYTLLPKDCKIYLHWPTVLYKVDWECTNNWKSHYTALDMEVIEDKRMNLFANHPGLQPRMRAVLLEWLIEVCDVFKLHRETYHLALDYIDRYLQYSSNVPKAKLQLIGISCLLVACKLEEIYPPKVAELAFVTDGACCEEDILAMEISVINVLKWKFKCITSNCWLLIYLQLGYLSVQKEKTLDYLYPLYPPELYSVAAQLLDLATLDVISLRFSYSVLAISVLHIVCIEKFPLMISGYKLSEIEECVTWMETFWFAICDKKKRENPNFQSCPLSPPKRVVTDVTHFLQQHVVNLELLECAQANAERLMHPSPSSLNILTPPSSSEKPGC